ncbi:protein G12 [Anabrus simplex]|uniref:protein G12 n=1 Tax=Anabrus simplex TaxID=316456 RepID=UPI0035A3AAB1
MGCERSREESRLLPLGTNALDSSVDSTDAMKLLLAFVFTLALAIGSGKETTLEEDFEDFFALLPQKQIQDILLNHLTQDSEFQDVIVYLQSDHWREFLTSIEGIPEYQKTIEYLGSEGVNIQKIIDLLSPIGVRSSGRKTLVELLDEIAAILPAKDLQKLYTDKIKTSPHFVHFLEYLHGPDMAALVYEVQIMPEFHDIFERLSEKGVDLYEVVEYIKWLFTGKTRQ